MEWIEDSEHKMQTKIVKYCIGGSFLVHLILFFFDIALPTSKIRKEEWSIQAELIQEPSEEKPKTNAQKSENKAQEIVEANQLPRRHLVKGEDDVTDKAPPPDPKIATKLEKQEIKPEDTKTIEDALRKLAKEEEEQASKKIRANSKQDSDERKAINKALNDRKKALEDQAQGKGQDLSTHPYIKELRQWILRFYQLPEIYAEKFRDKQSPIVELVIDSEGNIRNLKLYESSKEDILDQLAIKTIREAAPFPKPPLAFVGKTIHLPFNP